MATEGVASRVAAARAVDAVLASGKRLDHALAEGPPLPAREQAQAQALAFGALRWHWRHRALINAMLDRRLRRQDRILEAVLSVGLFELSEGHAPGYASVSAAVETTRKLNRRHGAGLVNATLRRFQRERDALLARVNEDDSARYAHPDWLVQAIRRDWPTAWRDMLAANQVQPPLWLRVNRCRTTVAEAQLRLADAGLDASESDHVPGALRLADAVGVDALPGFAEGELSVQDAGAQLAAPILKAEPGERVLDACAAPGGKANHLLEIGGDELELVALDADADRLAMVEANLSRLGQRATVIAADARKTDDWWDGNQFDAILLDAPCSATGVIRRHPDIRFLRRATDLERFAQAQHELLASLWAVLRPGGRLLYATCSVLRAENQDVVAGFQQGRADADIVATGLPQSAVADDCQGPGQTILPGAGAMDGFYYALIKKRAA